MKRITIIFTLLLLLTHHETNAFQLLGQSWPQAAIPVGYWVNLNIGTPANDLASAQAAANTWGLLGNANFSYQFLGTNNDTIYTQANATNTIMSIAGGAPWNGQPGCARLANGGFVLGFHFGFTVPGNPGQTQDSFVVICRDTVAAGSGNPVLTNWNSGPGAPAANQSDLTSVIAHELGHLLGLDHSCAGTATNTMPACPAACGTGNNNLTTATMCFSTPMGAVFGRDIDADDIAGIQAIYGINNPDLDGDGVANQTDNCPLTVNPGQENTDGDGMGNACDPDDDNDGRLDAADNCPLVSNGDQMNTDGDALGNACDPDDDNDDLSDAEEQSAGTNPLVKDSDNDGLSDGDEVKKYQSNPLAGDTDGDGIADGQEAGMGTNLLVSDNPVIPIIMTTLMDDPDDQDTKANAAPNKDSDNDGINNESDNCPDVPNHWQWDVPDEDGVGNRCDPDWDNDGILNEDDNCKFAIGDACEQKGKWFDEEFWYLVSLKVDPDGDGVLNYPDFFDDGVELPVDNCPDQSNPDQQDSDGNGVGDLCD